MKLSFKDLKQQKFEIDAEPTDTVRQLKEKIATFKGEGWEAEKLKLIYSGKILQDGNTVESYSIEEKGYVVCMVQKPKPTPASSSAPQAAPSTPAPSARAVQTPAAPAPAPVPQPSAQTSNVPATPTPAPQTQSTSDIRVDDQNALALGADAQSAIENMLAMGFERPQVERAMRAAFYNPDRAVEYLLNGIPENLGRENPAPAPTAATRNLAPTPATATTAAAPTTTTQSSQEEPFNMFEAAAQATRGDGTTPTPQASAGTGAVPATGASPATGNLDFLRENPQFQQLRQLIQQQPSMLEPILNQLGSANPQLLQLVNNNTEEFLHLLAAQGDDDAVLPPGAQTLQVTEDERDAIERLCRLGFERDLVIQAYFACDKNEELAANFLFDQPEDDDQQ